MHDHLRRAVGYGTATAAAAALVWAGFVKHTPADLGTLLSSIDMQLRMAYAMPTADKQGKPLSARGTMIDDAERKLAEAEKLDPELAMLREYRGFVARMRGDWRTAATCYAEARELKGVDAEMRDTLVFNEARMLVEAGEPKAALQVYERHAAELQPKYGSQCDLERAALLHRLDRDAEAKDLLRAVLAKSGEVPMAWVRAGEQFETLGDDAAAEQAFARAAERADGLNYFRARLKLRQGEVDRCLQLLARALQSAPVEVRRWVKTDHAAWQELESDARYRQLFAAAAAPAQPGR